MRRLLAHILSRIRVSTLYISARNRRSPVYIVGTEAWLKTRGGVEGSYGSAASAIYIHLHI